MLNQQWEGVLRHILTLVGGLLLAFGWLDTEIVEQGKEVIFQVVGAIAAVIAFWRSWFTKKPEGEGIQNLVRDAIKENLDAAVINNGRIKVMSDYIEKNSLKTR